MNYRHTKLLASTSLTNNTTYVLDIHVSDPISRITILYKALNGDNVPDGHPAKGVSKVELVDGSDVLYSMSGTEIQATDFYDGKQEPVNGMTYVNANYMWCTLNLNFGRMLYDKSLALDPKRFNNLQLKITHNYSNCGSSCSASTLEIWADVFQDKKISPSGYLMNKELYSYTSGADGSYEYIDLPTDYPIRRLTVQGLYDNYQPWQVVNEIRIDENNLKQIPVDEKVSNLLKTAAYVFGAYREGILLSATTSNDDFYITPTYEVKVAQCSVEDVDTTVHLEADSYGGTMTVESEANGEFNFLVEGYAPFGCIPIPFGDPADMADWYNVVGIGAVQLRLKAGSLGATGTPKVVLQQLRNY